MVRRRTLRKARGGGIYTYSIESALNGFSAAVGHHDGYKSPTEDRFSVSPIADNCILIGVYDGHTGTTAASAASQLIPKAVVTAVSEDAEILKDPAKIEAMLTKAVIETDKRLETGGRAGYDNSGTTVSLALVTPTHIIAANAGDSPILYFKSDGTMLFHSIDHDCENESELARISALGGECGVRTDGAKGVKNKDGVPSLMMTRSVGDFSFKPPVIPDPQTYVVERQPDSYLAVCSDSFTERFASERRDRIKNIAKPEDVVKVFTETFKRDPSLQKGVHAAVEDQAKMFYAYGRYSGDNTTLVAIKFPAPAEGGKKRRTRRKKGTRK